MNKLRVMVAIALFLLFFGCTRQTPAQQHVNASGAANLSPNTSNLPISARSFYIGLVPTPRSIPNSSFQDITDAYAEAGSLGEVSMVWVSPQGIGQYEVLKRNKVITALRVYSLKPVITLNFATLKNVPGQGLRYGVDAPEGVDANLSDPRFRKVWVDEAGNIAREFKPEYFSLGNEINDYFYFHPDELDSYLSLYDEASSAIHGVSPQTKVFVVFSYEHMLENNQSEMIRKLSGRTDLIGLTTYPWIPCQTPSAIPDDYYLRIKNYTDKPIAFTEIGWISSNKSSEEEQAEFLGRFLKLTDGMDIEMVNWLFLHEVALSGNGTSAAFSPESGTIALKKADGTEKRIYSAWSELKALKKR